jgi:VIT1/CCC1 family predicted Fe2+/Mn2+ transporter
MVLLRMLLGVTFVVKLLENHEKKTLEQYKQLVLDEAFDNNSRDALNKIIEEEGEIEKKLVSSIDEAVVRYLGFMMLGVADAIVELTGVQAGFLGVTDSPLVAGIAGLIVGVAAAISMGAASYLQARQGMSEKPGVSGVVTGLLYMLTVIALASPYFIIKDIFTAFASAITLALLLIALLTFYTSVIQERSFRNEYLLNVSILLVVAFGTFFLGKLLGAYFGVGSLLPA